MVAIASDGREHVSKLTSALQRPAGFQQFSRPLTCCHPARRRSNNSHTRRGRDHEYPGKPDTTRRSPPKREPRGTRGKTTREPNDKTEPPIDFGVCASTGGFGFSSGSLPHYAGVGTGVSVGAGVSVGVGVAVAVAVDVAVAVRVGAGVSVGAAPDRDLAGGGTSFVYDSDGNCVAHDDESNLSTRDAEWDRRSAIELICSFS